MSKNENLQWKSIIFLFVGLLILWFFSKQPFLSTLIYRDAGSALDPNIAYIIINMVLVLIKILWVLLLIGLVIGVFQEINKSMFGGLQFSKFDFVKKTEKANYTCATCKIQLSEEFKFCPNCKTNLRNQCANCGKELLSVWKCCPNCGAENKK